MCGHTALAAEGFGVGCGVSSAREGCELVSPLAPPPHPREGQAGGSVLEQGSSRARRDAGPGQTAGPALRAGRSGFASVLALGPRSLAWDRQDPETPSES